MSAKLEVSVVTKNAKKSIEEFSRTLQKAGKDAKGLSLIGKEERKFIKEEMGKIFSDLKSKLKDNRNEFGKLIAEQKRLKRNSQEELEIREKISKNMRTQSEIATQMDKAHKMQQGAGGSGAAGMLRGVPGLGGMAGGMGMLGMVGSLGLGALAGVAGYGITKGVQANSQYVAGAKNRMTLQGLGMQGNNFGSPGELAGVGLTIPDMIRRKGVMGRALGRANASNNTIANQAGFERSFGLEGGTMANSAIAMRANFGGSGANQAQMKLQASVLASGMEDAIGPYLESATALLNDINENGMTASTEMIKVMAHMAKGGGRTPEQLAKQFSTLNNGIKGSSGEANAFFQQAFGSMGIGGGALGTTKMAIESGGLFGLDSGALGDRGYNGYNKNLIKNMKSAGMVDNFDKRAFGILREIKSRGGMDSNSSINSITDVSQMSMMGNFANSLFGTKGMQGFDTLKLLEDAQNKKMKPDEFRSKLKDIKEKTPENERLDKINKSLAGQTQILRDINTSIMENLGEEAVKASNFATDKENKLLNSADGVIEALKNLTDTLNGKSGKDGKSQASVLVKNRTGKVGYR